MTLSSYNPYDRYKRKKVQKGFSFFASTMVLFCFAMAGYWFGEMNAANELSSLKEQNQNLRSQNQAFQNSITELHAEVQTMEMRLEQVDGVQQEMLSEGPMRQMALILKEHLENGVGEDRLMQTLLSLRPPTDCSEKETLRFVVRTENFEGPDSAATFPEDVLIVKGQGQSATNEKGEAESWYDPSKAVQIAVQAADGTERQLRGILPIKHHIVVGEREYRLNISEGAKSFAKVEFDSCAYP